MFKIVLASVINTYEDNSWAFTVIIACLLSLWLKYELHLLP
jgi:hypothetical protein